MAPNGAKSGPHGANKRADRRIIINKKGVLKKTLDFFRKIWYNSNNIKMESLPLVMLRILITGFEPFGGREHNPSGDVLPLIHGTSDTEISRLLLPVTWDGAPDLLTRETDRFCPDAIIMFGLASGSEFVRVERVGLNICGAIKDAEGKYPSSSGKETRICDGANAYFSTFDHACILDSLKENGIPAAYSFSAGTYICNLVLYTALKINADLGKHMKIGFIHLPDATDYVGKGKKSLGLDVIVRAAQTAVLSCK